MHDRRSFLLVLAAAVAAAIVLVPRIVSGGPSEPLSPQEYRVALMESVDGFDLSGATGAAALDDLAGDFRSAAEELSEIEPPPDAAVAHDRLVAGLGDYADRLGELADSGRAGAVQFQMQLAEHQLAGEDWIEAFTELAERGYLTSPVR
jgi:hypothetical protein